jgi:hypothetical protein
LNHSYNAWKITALHSSPGLVPSLLDPEALEKRGPLASAAILRFSSLEIDFPFGSPQISPSSDIFKRIASKNPTKQQNLPPPSVVDSQPKTQRSGWEKTKCNTPFQTPTIQLGLVGSGGKGGRAPPFIGETLSFPPPWPRVARPRVRTGRWPHDACPRASAWTRGHGPTRTRVRVDAIFTARTRFLPRPRITADVGGRPDDVHGCLDKKDVRTDIFIQKRPL